MIVRLTEPRDSTRWLTKGAEYVVLSIEFFHGKAHFRLIGDEGGRFHGVAEVDCFEIVDARPSALWTVRRDDGSLTIGPAGWSLDFWDDFGGDWADAMSFEEMGERNRAAVRAFDSAVADLYIEAGRPWPNTPDAASDIRKQ